VSERPAFVTGRRRQHELLKSWPTWALTSILIDPAEVARVRDSGWSGTHHTDPTSGERIVGTPDGLGFGVDESWHNPREVIAWSDVEAVATTVPAEIRELLVELRTRIGQHHKEFPRFSASGEAVGCGPIVEGQPLTPRQEAYVRELEAFEASRVLPAWERARHALDAERLELHDRALSAVLDRGPTDLLELLDEQPPERIVPTQQPEATRRIRNYTDHQRAALENLFLPEQFTVFCEQKTAHAAERVVFEYVEGDRSDAVMLDVDDRSRGYLDAGAAVLVARAHARYQRQARNPMFTEAARAMSGRAADLLGGWLATHPSMEVRAWQQGQNAEAGRRPAIAPPSSAPASSLSAGGKHVGCEPLEPAHLARPSGSGPAR
jgi:hypothetical protein